MRGHTSFVNDAIFADDDALVVSGGSDGDVRVWDARTAEPRGAPFAPPQPDSARASGAKAPVATVVGFGAFGGSDDTGSCVLVVPRHGDAAHVMRLDGSVERSFRVEDLAGEPDGAKRLVSGAVSPKGDFVYALAGDGAVHCFATASGKREHKLDTRAPDALGLCHHPKQNALATFAAGGGVKLWRA
jgi:WD40 repeat-containing protein SMU1